MAEKVLNFQDQIAAELEKSKGGGQPQDKPVDTPVDKPADKPQDKPEDKPDTTDYKPIWQKNFGVDDIEPIKKKVKEYDEVQTKYAQTTKDLEEARKQAAEYKLKSEASPFADDVVKTINDLRKEGKDAKQLRTYLKVADLDLTTASPKEILILKKQLQGNLSYTDAQAIVEDDYDVNQSLYVDGEGNLDEARYNKAKQIKAAKQKEEAAGAIDYLTGLKKTFTTPVKTQSEQENAFKVRIEQARTFAPQFQKVYTGLKDFPVYTNEDKSVVSLGIEPDKEFVDGIPKMLEGYYSGNKDADFSEQGLNTAMGVIHGMYVASHLQEISDAIAKKAVEAYKEEVARKRSNPSGKPNDPPGGQPDEKNPYKKLADERLTTGGRKSSFRGKKQAA